MELLCRYRWPGNVRELRNVIERTLVLHGTCDEVLPEFLPDELRHTAAPVSASVAAAASLEDAVRKMDDALKQAQQQQKQNASQQQQQQSQSQCKNAGSQCQSQLNKLKV